MNHYDYNTPMSERDDQEPPACPECVKLQRRIDDDAEHLSEIVYDPNTDGTLTVTPLMRCTPDLPEIVTGLIEALKAVDREAEALIGEANWYASSQAPTLMRKVRAALAAVPKVSS